LEKQRLSHTIGVLSFEKEGKFYVETKLLDIQELEYVFLVHQYNRTITKKKV